MKGFPLELGTGVRDQKLECWGYQMVKKSFKIGLAVKTQHQHVMNRQTDKHRTTANTALCRVSCGKNLGFFLQKNTILGFNLQMPDTKLQPTSTMKSKDKSIE